MKEEVGMKRRGPSNAVVGVATVGLMACLATAAVASVDVAFEDIYINRQGVSGAVGTTVPANRFAGPTLNPGGQGQLLYGHYYDVRPVVENNGATEAQHTNIQIVNATPPGWTPSTPLGVLARIRFRESKTSQEILDFDIALSCAEVWSGAIFLRENGTTTAIKSVDPIVVQTTATQIRTDNVLDTDSGQPFLIRTGPVTDPTAAADSQRGYFEVFAQEALPCEPNEGEVLRTGNIWTRLTCGGTPDRCTPPEHLGGVVFLVRPASGVAYEYTMTAISRFVFTGSNAFPITSDAPNIKDCVMPNNGALPPTTDELRCQDQVSFVLMKSRIMGQWDENEETLAKTLMVVTMPTKWAYCPPNNAGTDYNGVANPPFSCARTDLGGEEVLCTVYDRLENSVTNDPIFSPAQQERCFLPREVTIFGIGPRGLEDTRNDIPNAPWDTTQLEVPNGWIDIDLYAGSVPPPLGTHVLTNDVPANQFNFLALGFFRARGLPVIASTIQDFFNISLQGGVYGAMAPSMYEVSYSAAS